MYRVAFYRPSLLKSIYLVYIYPMKSNLKSNKLRKAHTLFTLLQLSCEECYIYVLKKVCQGSLFNYCALFSNGIDNETDNS